MNQQIVNELLRTYKEKGVDLSAIVNNPLFLSLPVEQQISAIKQHAEYISSNSAKTLSKKDIKGILVDGMLAAGMAGAATGGGIVQGLKFYTGGKIPMGTMAKVMGASAALGMAGSAVSSLTSIMNKHSLAKKFEELKNEPTDSKAIELLIQRSLQAPSIPRQNILGKVYSNIKQRESDVVRGAATNGKFDTFYQSSVSNVPLAPGVTQEAWEQAKDELINRRNKFN